MKEMTEMEMLKVLRPLIAKVAGQDRITGRVVGNIEQSKAEVRSKLVAAVPGSSGLGPGQEDKSDS